jgi:hypothetical protein
MGWAVSNWVFLEGRALKDGLLRNGSLLSFPPTLFLSYVESLVREFEDGHSHLEDLYDVSDILNDRQQQIREALAAFGG